MKKLLKTKKGSDWPYYPQSAYKDIKRNTK